MRSPGNFQQHEIDEIFQWGSRLEAGVVYRLSIGGPSGGYRIGISTPIECFPLKFSVGDRTFLQVRDYFFARFGGFERGSMLRTRRTVYGHCADRFDRRSIARMETKEMVDLSFGRRLRKFSFSFQYSCSFMESF